MEQDIIMGEGNIPQNENIPDNENNESYNIYKGINEFFGSNPQDIRMISPLTFAYIGDCIYDLVIRSVVVGRGNASVNSLHKKTCAMVKASSQKKAFEKIESMLTQEEMDVYKRGRNAKSYTSAKNASKADYHVATGFEALIGYLYMTGRINRMFELIKHGLGEEE